MIRLVKDTLVVQRSTPHDQLYPPDKPFWREPSPPLDPSEPAFLLQEKAGFLTYPTCRGYRIPVKLRLMNYPASNNDYSFITNTAPPRRGLAGAPRQRRLVLYAVGGVVALVVAIVVLNLLTSGSRRAAGQLTDLEAYQAELLRVVDLGSTDGQTTLVRGRAHSAALTLQSDNLQLNSYLAQRHIRIPAATKTKYHFSSFESALTSAATNNNYDATYQKLFDSQLNDYQKLLTATYNAQTGKIIRQDLSGYYAHTKLLYFVKPATN